MSGFEGAGVDAFGSLHFDYIEFPALGRQASNFHDFIMEQLRFFENEQLATGVGRELKRPG